jgi:hypothetical protein
VFEDFLLMLSFFSGHCSFVALHGGRKSFDIQQGRWPEFLMETPPSVFFFPGAAPDGEKAE